MATEISATIYGLWNNNYTGTTNVTPPRAGMYFRSNGYIYEVLCAFNLTAHSGKTVSSAQIKFTVSGSGVGTVAQTVYAMEQNKTNPTSWSSPPIYNNFGNFPGTHTYWDTQLSSVSNVLSNGEYTINDTSDNIKDLVQSWIDNSADNWGIVLTRNDGTTLRYVVISAVKLVLEFVETTALDYGMRFQSGASQYLASASTFTPSANISVVFWLYLPSLNQFGRIVSQGANWEVGLSNNAGSPPNAIVNALNSGSDLYSSTLTVETRYHVVCTATASARQVFLNGALSNSAASGGTPPSAATLYMGVQYGGTSYFLNGYIGECTVCKGESE